jgi:hypothetical protein
MYIHIIYIKVIAIDMYKVLTIVRQHAPIHAKHLLLRNQQLLITGAAAVRISIVLNLSMVGYVLHSSNH